MELSPRLKAVADWVPLGARLIDVGTDHAQLPVWLIKNQITSKVIASDLRQGPLNKAKETAARYGVFEQIEFRLCNGLADMTASEVDTITIAGMGGETIANILGDAPWTGQGSHTLILQPMSSLPELRYWLSANDFTIERELIVCEDITLYTIMKVHAGKMVSLTPGEIWAGRQDSDMDWSLRSKLLEKLHRRAVRACDGLRRSTREEDEQKLREFERLADELDSMKREWASWQR